MASPPKLSRAQIESVLRKAAEIEAARNDSRADGAGNDEDEGLEPDDVVRLGEEAGLPRGSLLRALGELRRESLGTDHDEGALARSLGAGRLVITRDVPGSPEPVRRAVERFLRDQLMTIRRHHGDRIEWERAQGLWPGLARSLDFARRYAFGPVSRIETLVTSDGPDSTSVTFHIDLREMRRQRMVHAVLRAGLAFTVVGLAGTSWFPGFGLPDLLALTAGGAVAGGLFALDRRRYDLGRERIALGPEKFLDLLVQRRLRAMEPTGAAAPAADE